MEAGGAQEKLEQQSVAVKPALCVEQRHFRRFLVPNPLAGSPPFPSMLQAAIFPVHSHSCLGAPREARLASTFGNHGIKGAKDWERRSTQNVPEGGRPLK